MFKDYSVLAIFLAIMMVALAYSVFDAFVTEYGPIQDKYVKLTNYKGFEKGVKQVNVKMAGGLIIDRCTTCHLGVDNKDAAAFDQPLKTHPPIVPHVNNDPHKFSELGCVSCHQGNGRGIDKKDAHGEYHDWPNPMLKGKDVQASCAKCHETKDQTLAGADVYNLGKKLYIEKACWSCHTIEGVSAGKKGPLLTDAGSKFTMEYLIESIVDPTANTPVSKMPKFDWVDDKEVVHALAVYLKGQTTKKIRSSVKSPVEYKAPVASYRNLNEASVEVGRRIFIGESEKGDERGGCLNCHSYKDSNGILSGGVIGPELTYVTRNRSDEYIRQHIINPNKNNVDTTMPKFDTLTATELDSLMLFLNSLDFSPSNRDPVNLFANFCASCHGHDLKGKGLVSTMLDPLPRDLANFQFVSNYQSRLKESILKGVDGTPMPPWDQVITEDEADALVGYIAKMAKVESKKFVRLDVKLPKVGDKDRRSMKGAEHVIKPADAKNGKVVFSKFCTSCHGILANGKGPNAYDLKHPMPRNLLNKAFVNSIKNIDERFYKSIVLGVPGTPMPPHDFLSDQSILDAIAFIKKINQD